MKVSLCGYSPKEGGAAIATRRLHAALLGAGVEATLWSNKFRAEDIGHLRMHQGPTSLSDKALSKIRPWLGKQLTKVLRTQDPILHSTQMLSNRRWRELSYGDADIINFHWIQGELLSISDIERLKDKVRVWTLHDMWPFLGAEHYSSEQRWLHGYTRYNRPQYEHGIDINRITWERKRRIWSTPFQIITPSNWLADCVKASALFSDWPVKTIHNPIDSDRWAPVPKDLARDLLGLPLDKKLILFGAVGGTSDLRKGFDLLDTALKIFSGASTASNVELVIYGGSTVGEDRKGVFPARLVGRISSQIDLRLLYCASDLMVVPSRMDNLPNTAVESVMCGTPVVGFRVGGLPDIVSEGVSGCLAEPFDVTALAEAIEKTLLMTEFGPMSSSGVRDDALSKFDSTRIANLYKELFLENLEGRFVQ